MAETESIIADIGVVKTKEDAKQLADLHLALAQKYRAMAGLPPIPTGAYQRRLIEKSNNQAKPKPA